MDTQQVSSQVPRVGSKCTVQSVVSPGVFILCNEFVAFGWMIRAKDFLLSAKGQSVCAVSICMG